MKYSDGELQELKDSLSYDPVTGQFIWLHTIKSKNNRGPNAGDVAGNLTREGYVRINYKSRHIMAHHMAWLFIYGSLPSQFIDHIDRNKSNNSIRNLREVTRSENGQNRNVNAHSATGITGVTIQGNGFSAGITINKKRFSYYFDTFEDAVKCREALAKEHHPCRT